MWSLLGGINSSVVMASVKILLSVGKLDEVNV